ncbi:MAG: hypothetical protein WCE94_14775 [Candidatus Methanoperedens sp.]
MVLVAAASIIIDVFFLNDAKNSHIAISLFKIVILSLSIYTSMYYQFPEILGNDPWWHNAMIQEIVYHGHIPSEQIGGGANIYYIFPIFHLIGAIATIITSLPIYSSIFGSVGIPFAIAIIFVFLIGRKLVSVKAGLLAALIVSLTASTIERATAIIPMSLGYIFFLAILYLTLSYDKRKNSFSMLIILLSITLILTHPIAALVILLVLIVIFVSIRLYKTLEKSDIKNEAVSLTFIIFFGVTMITRWMQNPPRGMALFDYSLRNLIGSLKIDAQFVLATSPSPDTTIGNISSEIALLEQSGFLILLFLAIIGVLIFLHSSIRNTKRIALVSIAGLLISIPYIFLLFKLKNILPDRWFIFLYVPLSILTIAGLLCVSNLIKNKVGKMTVVALVVLAIIFTMTTNSIANGDSPLFFNGVVRIGFTQSEHTAIKTLSKIDVHPITDDYYISIFPYIIGYDKYSNMVQSKNRVLILRDYYLHNPEWNEKYLTRLYETGFGYYVPDIISNYAKNYEIGKKSLIYNNGNVKVYPI